MRKQQLLETESLFGSSEFLCGHVLTSTASIAFACMLLLLMAIYCSTLSICTNAETVQGCSVMLSVTIWASHLATCRSMAQCLLAYVALSLKQLLRPFSCKA